MANAKILKFLMKSARKNNQCSGWNDLRLRHVNNLDNTWFFRITDLTQPDLSNADLNGANLSGANLSNANLSNANLSNANLSNADLNGANLNGANLFNADLSGANLSEVDLSEVSLYAANLSDVDLHGVDLSGKDLRWTNLSEANLNGANLTSAIFNQTNLQGTDISDCVGLDTIIFRGPAFLSEITIYNCQGIISEFFLRRCNVSETIITLARSLRYRSEDTSLLILPSTVFLSYSRHDKDFVDRVEFSLNERGITTWKDRTDIPGGENWVNMIEEAVRACEMMVVVLSPESVVSDNVQREYVYADKMLKFVIPLQYRACDLPFHFVTANFVDFSMTPYDEALDKLVEAINQHKVV